MQLIIISGMSGSGKSVVLTTYEDLGFYCIDNLPWDLLEALAKRADDDEHGVLSRVAVSIDARTQLHNLPAFGDTLNALRRLVPSCELLFVHATDPVLIKRFSETRRKHPLSDRDTPLIDALAQERALLEPIASRADSVIDTTHISPHELRDIIIGRNDAHERGLILVLMQSFGFKNGLPTDSDFVFDVRCLANPHWDPELRPLTGLDPAVAAYLEQHPPVHRLFEQLRDLLLDWIPAFTDSNRMYLTISIGCTGGQHRSVYMVERLADALRARGLLISTHHRELHYA